MSKSWNNIATYAFIGVMVLGLSIHRTRNNKSALPEVSAQATPTLIQALQPPDDSAHASSSSTNSLKLLNFNLSLSSPKDLRVKQGDTVAAGEVLADRREERSRLTAQRQVLILSLQKIEGATMTAPPPPASVPAVSTMPPISYAEEEAAINSSALAIQQAQRAVQSQQEKLKGQPLEESSAVRRAFVNVSDKQHAVDIQHRKLDAVQSLKDLPPEVLPHEQEVLKQRELELKQAQAYLGEAQAKEQAASRNSLDKLQQLVEAVEKAKAEQQLAISKLQTAKDKRGYQEYEYSVTQARRAEEKNQATQNYSRQMQEAEQHQRDREFQIAQIQAKISEVDNQLSTLSSVKTPYAGVIRHIKFTQQKDKNLSVELVLAINAGATPIQGGGTNTKDTAISSSRNQSAD